MSGVASAIAAAATVGGAVIKGQAAKKAAKKQAKAQDAAAAEQRAALAKIEPYQQPYRDAGTSALNDLTKVNSGDYSAFEKSPDYLYAKDQALKGVEGSAAARGGLYSGNNLRALETTGAGLASQNLGNYRNSLFNQIGIGQQATNVLTNATLGTASNVGNNLIGAGDARASGIIGQGNAYGGALQDLGSIFGGAYGGLAKKPVGGANSLYGYNTYMPSRTSGLG